MSDFIPEDNLDDYDQWWQEFRDRVQERLEATGAIEGIDPLDAMMNVLADIHIGVQQAYIIMRTIREELEGLSEKE